MHLKTRNINTAFKELVEGIHSGTIPTQVVASRAGEVAAVEEPVIVSYSNPKERVLFNPYRDCNVYFHLYEALWMLAGRNDVAPLQYYCSRMKEFSDDGETFNGAYGYRWRHASEVTVGEDYYQTADWKPIDQIEILIKHLKRKPESRRAVLQMWNVEDDLLKIDLSRDICCNLSALLSTEQGVCDYCKGTGIIDIGDNERIERSCPVCEGKPLYPKYLNITVFNRSNDMIWVLLGANIVHFSVLLEYVAARLGLGVGAYHQVTNNMHVYTERWEPEKWLQADEDLLYSWYQSLFPPRLVPLVKDPATFDKELPEFAERHSKDAIAGEYAEPFLAQVAQPMMIAFHHYKRGALGDALRVIESVAADDWRLAGKQWLERRFNKRKKNHEAV